MSVLQTGGATHEEVTSAGDATATASLPFFELETLEDFAGPCFSTLAPLPLSCTAESADMRLSAPWSMLGKADEVAGGSLASLADISSTTAFPTSGRMCGSRSPLKVALSNCIPNAGSQTDQNGQEVGDNNEEVDGSNE